LDDKDATVEAKTAERKVNRVLVYFLLLLNSAVLVGIFAMIFSLIFSAMNYSQTIVWIVSGVLLLIAIVALIPIARKISHHSIWTHPHFSSATLAQFFYVAAQAGIFSFFINYMTSELPAIPTSVTSDLLKSWFETTANGVISLSDKGAANLASVGFFCFLTGRFIGSGLLKKFSAHKLLGLYGVINVIACLLIFLKLGWFSVACVFLSYFFMSIMFPTIFALGIFGLGARAKKAAAYIVMAIMGGAILPKLMGYVADKSDMSRGFIVPLFCFVFIAIYGFCWPKLSGAEGLHDVKATGGH
jgi:FHS family L-fucose permease-like MFS transporter